MQNYFNSLQIITIIKLRLDSQIHFRTHRSQYQMSK